MVSLIEMLAEFNLLLWVCVVDFEKALDTVNHDSIWAALEEQHVPWVYIRTLEALYKDQTGRTAADRVSKT